MSLVKHLTVAQAEQLACSGYFDQSTTAPNGPNSLSAAAASLTASLRFWLNASALSANNSGPTLSAQDVVDILLSIGPNLFSTLSWDMLVSRGLGVKDVLNLEKSYSNADVALAEMVKSRG